MNNVVCVRVLAV